MSNISFRFLLIFLVTREVGGYIQFLSYNVFLYFGFCNGGVFSLFELGSVNDSYTDHLCYCTQLVRTECVFCPQALLRNEVPTIFGIIFLLFFLRHIIFSQKGLSQGYEILHRFLSHKKNKILGKQKNWDSPSSLPGALFSVFLLVCLGLR